MTSVCKHGRHYICCSIPHSDVNTGTSYSVDGFISGWLAWAPNQCTRVALKPQFPNWDKALGQSFPSFGKVLVGQLSDVRTLFSWETCFELEPIYARYFALAQNSFAVSWEEKYLFLPLLLEVYLSKSSFYPSGKHQDPFRSSFTLSGPILHQGNLHTLPQACVHLSPCQYRCKGSPDSDANQQ